MRFYDTEEYNKKFLESFQKLCAEAIECLEKAIQKHARETTAHKFNKTVDANVKRKLRSKRK